jgi:2-dehydropantoate 2-reductase
MAHDRSVVVFGAGAVGGYLGGSLALHAPRLRVTLVARESVAMAVRTHGLSIREGEVVRVAHPQAVTSVNDAVPADMVILTVRTFDVPVAIEGVERLLKVDGVVVAFQNGVGTEAFIGASLGPRRVIAGTLTAAVRTESPGKIVRAGRGGGIALAPLDGDLAPWVVEAFEPTGLPVIAMADYRSLRWSKLLLNMLGAPLSAILDVGIDRIVADARLFRIERAAFLEAVHTMSRLGISARALPGYPVPLVVRVMQLPAPVARGLLGGRLASSRGGESPTMRSEVARGRTEVGALNGAVAEAAARAGTTAPVNAALCDLVQSLTMHRDERGRYRENPAALLAYLRERSIAL